MEALGLCQLRNLDTEPVEVVKGAQLSYLRTRGKVGSAMYLSESCDRHCFRLTEQCSLLNSSHAAAPWINKTTCSIL